MSVPDSAPSTQSYWNRAAESYEQDFSGTLVGRTHRAAIWRELDRVFSPGQHVLELSCGTGIDAAHLADRGIRVLACDISPRMIELARELRDSKNLHSLIDFRVLPTEQLSELSVGVLFDGVFSSFSGLNCVQDLPPVRKNLARLVKPGAKAIFSVMGRFAPWEILWFLVHGDPKKALRRCQFRDVFALNSGDVPIVVRSIKEMSRCLAPEFRLKRWKGVGIAVPPSYLESWARRFSAATLVMAQLDRVLGHLPLLRGCSDCVVLEFERMKSTGKA